MLGALARNWELRLASVVLAFALWLFVMSRDKSQVSLAAPIEYVGVDAGHVLVGKPRESVDVQLQAPRWAMARLVPDQVRVRVDVSRVRAGESVIPLSPAQVEVPSGLTVTGLAPAWLRVTVAAAATKSLRVVPELSGALAPGFAVFAVAAEPSAVDVKGPRATLDARSSISTGPVDIAGGRERMTRTVGLMVPDALTLLGARVVQVTIDVRPEDPKRSKKRGTGQ